QAIAVKPDHARAQNNLGLVLAQQGEREAALAAFRRAHCSPAQAHTNLAVILALNNHAEDARKHLQLAHRHLEPNDREIEQRLEELEVLIANRESQQSLSPGRAEEQSAAMPPAPYDEQKSIRVEFVS